MARRDSNIKQGALLKAAQENLITYERQKIDDNTSVRSKGGNTKASRVRVSAAVRPFGLESATKFIVPASKVAVEKFQASCKDRCSIGADALTAATKAPRGYRPAKAHFFDCKEKAAQIAYKLSKRTKLYYVGRAGTSYTLPFGAITDKEEYQAAAAAMVALGKKTLTGDYDRVWCENEKF